MKLITVNIEGNKHLLDIGNLIAVEQPDVLCLQEVFATDLPQLVSAVNQYSQTQQFFVANANVVGENKYGIAPNGEWGNAMIARSSLFPGGEALFAQEFYSGSAAELPEFSGPNSPRRSLLAAVVSVRGQSLAICTTHFTWSAEGKATELQQRDAKLLQTMLKRYNSYILCGDLNSPRGGATYTTLSTGLTDHLPREIMTTIDPDLHYAGALQLAVDTVFSTPDIHSMKAKVVSGVSDHMAVVVDFDF